MIVNCGLPHFSSRKYSLTQSLADVCEIGHLYFKNVSIESQVISEQLMSLNNDNK